MDMGNIGSQTAASLLQGLPGFQLASLSSLGTYTMAGGDPNGLAYADLAEALQRMLFNNPPSREAYPVERKLSYDPETYNTARYGGV